MASESLAEEPFGAISSFRGKPEEGETSGRGPLEHLPTLDGLRGVAVLMVVFYHYLPRAGGGGLFRIGSFGWAGVDIFFVLSGFLITTILFRQRTLPHALPNFYVRRVLRLFPLFYVLAGLMLLLTPVLHLHWKWPQLAFLFYGANYLMAWNPGYSFIGPFALLHIWSLAVEEQFYMIWPWFVCAKLKRSTLLRICAGAFILAPVVRFLLLRHGVSLYFVYVSLPTRMDSLFAGAGLALMPLPSRKTAHLVLAVSAAILLGCVLRSHSLFSERFPMSTVGYSAIALAAATLIVLSLHSGTIVRRLLMLRPLRFYGRYSYGLYLWHYLLEHWLSPITTFCDRTLRSSTLAGIISVALILGISTVVAVGSYWIIERPFLRLKDRFERT